jgi:hypothetical protein
VWRRALGRTLCCGCTPQIIAENRDTVGLLPVLLVACPVVGGRESFACATHDAVDCPACPEVSRGERSRRIWAVQGSDLHEQAKGIARVNGYRKEAVLRNRSDRILPSHPWDGSAIPSRA